MPVTSVVIAGGSRGDLFECLLSLEEVEYTPHTILVIDNSAAGLADALAVSFPSARVARPAKAMTFSQAANFGLREAYRCAEWALLLNDDVTVHPEAVTLLASAAAKRGPGIYAPEIWPYNSQEPRTRWRIDWGKRLVVRERAGAATCQDIDYAEGSGVLVSQEVFARLNGFDEAFGFYYEDADFSVRARDMGFPVREVPTARVWHKGSVSAGKGLSPFKAYWRARNTMRFAMKHRRRAHVITNAAYHFGGFVGPQAVRAAIGTVLGSRRDAEVLAALVRGTLDYLTGNGHVFMPRTPPEDHLPVDALPILR
jgi:hypothetical protein